MRSELKLAILKTGLPQYRIAADMNRNPSWLSNIVRGTYEPDSLEKELLAERLRVPLDEIFPHENKGLSVK